MIKDIPESVIDEVNKLVHSSTDVCVAVDEELRYIAVNEATCDFLKIKKEELLGRSAIEKYPEIIASRNHRNMLRALAGESITNQLIESRTGAIFTTSYTPIRSEGKVYAVVLNGKRPR